MCEAASTEKEIRVAGWSSRLFHSSRSLPSFPSPCLARHQRAAATVAVVLMQRDHPDRRRCGQTSERRRPSSGPSSSSNPCPRCFTHMHMSTHQEDQADARTHARTHAERMKSRHMEAATRGRWLTLLAVPISLCVRVVRACVCLSPVSHRAHDSRVRLVVRTRHWKSHGNATNRDGPVCSR